MLSGYRLSRRNLPVGQDGDTTWTEWRWSGTRSDGQAFEMRGVTLFEVTGGQVAAGRLYLEDVEQEAAGIEQAVEDLYWAAGRGPRPSSTAQCLRPAAIEWAVWAGSQGRTCRDEPPQDSQASRPKPDALNSEHAREPYIRPSSPARLIRTPTLSEPGAAHRAPQTPCRRSAKSCRCGRPRDSGAWRSAVRISGCTDRISCAGARACGAVSRELIRAQAMASSADGGGSRPGAGGRVLCGSRPHDPCGLATPRSTRGTRPVRSRFSWDSR